MLKLCDHLKKKRCLIQIFEGDKSNKKLSNYTNKVLKHKNFNYYLIDNYKFLQELSFESLRFLNIYSINKNVNSINLKSLEEIEEDYTFQLSFENYLECVEITINYNHYDKQIIDKFLRNKCC